MTKRDQIGQAKMKEIENKLREAGYGEQIDSKAIWLNWSGEVALTKEMQSRENARAIAKIAGGRVEGWDGHYSVMVHIKFPKMARRFRYC